jgi:hypothetical protein
MSRRLGLVRLLSTARNYCWQESSSRDQRGAVVASTSANSSTTTTGLMAGVTAMLLSGAAAAAVVATTSAMTTASTTSTPTTVRRAACSPASLDTASDEKTKNTVVGNGQEMLCHTLFVWDFDWTVVNCNSDEYIPAQFLGPEATMQGFLQLYHDNPATKGNWHACVEQMVHRALRLVLLHQQPEKEGASSSPGTPTNRILEAAQQMPFLIPVQATLQAIHEKNTTGTGQMILSDGNTLFLQAFLQHIMPHIKFTHGIISNHGFWKKTAPPPSMGGSSMPNHQLSQPEDEMNDYSLCVVHQSQQYGGHDCPRCAANLCKTQALQETLKDYYAASSSTVADGSKTTTFPSTMAHVKQRQQRQRVGGPARIVYIGDGANDACPVLNVLGSGDVLLARVGRKRLHANERQGPESDQEATVTNNTNSDSSSTKNRDNQDHKDEGESLGSCFGIIPALEKAKLEDPSAVPACQVWEWTTGEELQQLVLKLLQELPPPPSPRDEQE